MSLRVGIGFDIHRLVPGRRLILGGVDIPFDRGLGGHSDADALLHAITDAVLGAAGLPDIGHYFPPGDPKWRGIASSAMLARAAAEAAAKGFAVRQVDAIVLAEHPKIGPYRDDIRRTIGRVLGIPRDDVQVKGKSNEGLDAVGRGEAIAAHAVVLLKRRPKPPVRRPKSVKTRAGR